MNARRFRSDLYYRLAVVTIHLPALRERLDDLPLLVERLLDSIRVSDADRAEVTAPAFLDELSQHAWPGNVRELRNYVERYVVLRERAPFEPAHAASEPTIDAARPLRDERERWLASFERRYLEAALARVGGNVTAAARASGIDRIHFYRLLWKHGLR